MSEQTERQTEQERKDIANRDEGLGPGLMVPPASSIFFERTGKRGRQSRRERTEQREMRGWALT